MPLRVSKVITSVKHVYSNLVEEEIHFTSHINCRGSWGFLAFCIGDYTVSQVQAEIRWLLSISRILRKWHAA